MASISKSFRKIIENYITKYAYGEKPEHKLLITHCENIDMNTVIENIAHENTQKVFFINCETSSYYDQRKTLQLIKMFQPQEVIIVFNDYISGKQTDGIRNEIMAFERELPNDVAKIAIMNDFEMFTKMNNVLQIDKWLAYDYASWCKHIGVDDTEEIDTYESDDEEDMDVEPIFEEYIISRNIQGDTITNHESGYLEIANCDDPSAATDRMITDICEFFQINGKEELIALIEEFDKKDPYSRGFFEKYSLVIKENNAEFRIVTRDLTSVFTKEQIITWHIDKKPL